MKVAVVGSGCAGLGATWALNEYSEHEVHLYESDSRPGGHANTLEFTNPVNGEKTMVDTGFIVLNPGTYPNFLRFLRHQSIPTVKTEMTFALTRDNGSFEWAGDTAFTLFCQPKNLFKASMWRMIWDILRFNACARGMLVEMEKPGKEGKGEEDMPIGEYLKKHGYSDSFRDDYLIPMCAAIWSTPPSSCADGFTARALLRFFHNHHLLQILGKPKWMTIPGGSIEYVRKVTKALPSGTLHMSSPVVSISTKSSGSKHQVTLRTASGKTEVYDRVILACHSDAAAKMLANGGMITEEEKEILGGVRWSKNEIVLHSDPAALPHAVSAWSSWNYVTTSEPGEKGKPGRANSDQFALSYLMNVLQLLDMKRFGPVICTLNPTFPLREETIQARIDYEHPTFDVEAERSQRRMPKIQNTRGVSYAGAWMGYGFHEDGFTHGLRAAIALGGVSLPFDVQPPHRRVSGLWIGSVFNLLELARRCVVFFIWGLFGWLL
ncbi:hypothetical protein FRC14_006981 [Serendipita sp. 396]|nr:hypothetical protein FRC14_006981 [Serendipita sp. 396]KAG8778266.1 hypothetical protein FRC15_010892 [Serendipita sp. 397]